MEEIYVVAVHARLRNGLLDECSDASQVDPCVYIALYMSSMRYRTVISQEVDNVSMRPFRKAVSDSLD